MVQTKLPCLVMHDRDTRLLGAIPTVQKGGKYLQYVITEFVRFIMHTQHREVALRSDLEPTNLAILDGVRKTCRGLGITIHHEPVPVSDHQANGAAESSLQQIRSRAGIFIEQIEKACAGGKKVFPCSHPLYAWAILHSAWIHNHFVVAAGATAYERELRQNVFRQVGNVWRERAWLSQNGQKGCSSMATWNLVGKELGQ